MRSNAKGRDVHEILNIGCMYALQFPTRASLLVLLSYRLIQKCIASLCQEHARYFIMSKESTLTFFSSPEADQNIG